MDKSIGDMKTMGGTPEHGGYTLFEGDTLGQYRVIRPLGRGGMGEVYEVEHETLELRYAIKLLPQDFSVRAGAAAASPIGRYPDYSAGRRRGASSGRQGHRSPFQDVPGMYRL